MIGIYFIIRKRKILYIGQSYDFTKRIPVHAKSMQFDTVRCIECLPDKLREYESRLIKIFKPELNFSLNPARPKAKRLSNDWVMVNASDIKIAIDSGDFKELFERAMLELGYSKRCTSVDVIATITRRYNKIVVAGKCFIEHEKVN